MSISKELDLAIKLSEIQTTAGGYTVGGRTYDTYMTNAAWKDFKNGMLPSALWEFGTGGGGELLEKNNRPPKMACYGSSSRMLYRLSCHKEGFGYEKKLVTTVGGTANLDGFFEEDYRYVFVEAKCHEPYAVKNHSVSKSYEKLYRFINAHMAGSVEIAMQPSACGRYLDVDYYADGEKLERFDMKQMICHLLGIATGVLRGDLEAKQIDFWYLLFDPTELELAPKTKETVDAIYERTCYECNLVDFAALLRVVFAFLKEERFGAVISDEEIDSLVCQFTFALVSQDLYAMLLG